MKLHRLCAASLISLCILSSNAFAIDQVILKNGAVVEGKILAEEPNLHVDIELTNGIKKRYEQSEIQRVERDVPSNSDSQMNGNTSEAYVGAQLGMAMNMTSTTTPVVAGTTTSFFTFGARAGVNVAQISDFAKLALGLTYTYTSLLSTGVVSAYSSNTDNQVMAQILFRKVGGTGFYFGGEVGMDFISMTTVALPVSYTANAIAFGGDVGYDYYFSPSFSMGPDIRFDYTNSATLSTAGSTSTVATVPTSFLKIMLTATLHL